MTVRANCRIIFRFEGNDAFDVEMQLAYDLAEARKHEGKIKVRRSGRCLAAVISRQALYIRWAGPIGGLVAGACLEAIHNALSGLLVRRWVLPRNGRRSRFGLSI